LSHKEVRAGAIHHKITASYAVGLLNVRATQPRSSTDDVRRCIHHENDRRELVPLGQAGWQAKYGSKRELCRVMAQSVDDPGHQDVENQ
jgi:hypothetical protein